MPAKEESDDVQLKARSKSQLGPQVARLDACVDAGSKTVKLSHFIKRVEFCFSLF